MKKVKWWLVFFLVFQLLGFTGYELLWSGYPYCTGSPGDGYQTCADCHGGPPVQVTNYFSVNIPLHAFAQMEGRLQYNDDFA